MSPWSQGKPSLELYKKNVAQHSFRRSRAIAVSASCDYFGIFMLKEPPVLQSQMANNQLNPILEVCLG